MQKPCEALPSQVFEVGAKVIKGQRAYFVFRPDHKGRLWWRPRENIDIANANATMGMRTHQTSALVVA